MFSLAIWMATIVTPLQIIAGDLHGLNTIEHQPAKVAAMEGHFETRKGAPLYLFGWPNMETAKIDYALEIPKLGSLILKHGLDEEVQGLKDWPKADWPNVPLVFWCFRIMVGLGVLMMFIGLAGITLRFMGRLYDNSLYLKASLLMGPSGVIALLCGWMVTEVGRQPYTVYGILRTADSVSPIGAPGLWGSLIAFVVVYLMVFTPGFIYILRMMKADPASDPINPPLVRMHPNAV
jgi:cytochrome d ubiquinol oxidase subunit I